LKARVGSAGARSQAGCSAALGGSQIG
jgi:hypothetical protein